MFLPEKLSHGLCVLMILISTYKIHSAPLSTSTSPSLLSLSINSPPVPSSELPSTGIDSTTSTSSLNITLQPTKNTSRTLGALPQAPFTLPIPSIEPHGSLVVLRTGRTGRSQEKYSLLDAIDEQMLHYQDAKGLPGPFTITKADVKFGMRPTTPKSGGKWMTMELAIGALQVLNALIEEYGAQECDFVVGSEGNIKGSFWVRFMSLDGRDE